MPKVTVFTGFCWGANKFSILVFLFAGLISQISKRVGMLQDFLSSIPSGLLERAKLMSYQLDSELGKPAVDELLSRSVLSGGKRLRPLLTYVMGNLFGLESDRLDPFARAIEMVHAASLAHDDVVDEASTRRGAPSINALAGNKKAVLAGDFLLADVIVGLSQTGELRLVQEMAMVIQELALGEWLQWDASHNRNYNAKIIEEIALKKTSSVMSWCAVAPAILARLSADEIALSRKFGKHLGLAFQQIDDTLDFSGDGLKDQHLDLKNGIVNSVVFNWLEKNPQHFARFQSGSDLESIFLEMTTESLSSSVDEVKNIALRNLEIANQSLEEIKEIWMKHSHSDIQRFENALETVQVILSYLAHRSS